MPVFLAAWSAIAFGVGDFLGGMSARRMAAVLGAASAQAAGFVLLVLLGLVVGGDPTGADLVWGAAAGLSGALALLPFYWAMGAGQMSVVAPVSAVTCALVPLVVGLALGERPGPLALAGTIAALGAIVLISREPGDPTAPDERSPAPAGAQRTAVLGAAVLAGLGFGLFLTAISRTASASGMWPLATARGTAVVVILLVALASRAGRPNPAGLRFALAAGCFDVTANALYLVAARSGLLSLVGVIGSMYPASTVVLARFVLKERLARHQLAGLALAALAVVAVTTA